MNTDSFLMIVQNKPLELGPRAEIEQESDLNGRRLQVIQYLRLMDSIERLQYLQFQQDISIHNQIGSEVPDHLASEKYRYRNLAHHLEARLSQCER